MFFRTKLLLILAFSLVATAAGVSFSVHLLASREAENAFRRDAAAHMDRVRDITRSHFAAGIEALQTLTALPEATDETLFSGEGGHAAAQSALLPRFESFRAAVPGMEFLFACYKNGFCVAVPEGSEKTQGESGDEDARKSGWYSDAALGAASATIGEAYISRSGKSLAAVAVAKIRNAAGDTVGVVAAGLTLASLTDALRDFRMGEDGLLVLFDDTGRIIFDPNAQENLLKSASATKDAFLVALAELPSGFHTATRGGEEYAAYAQTFDMPRWKAVLLQRKSFIIEQKNSLAHTASLAAFACAGAAFLLGAFCVRRALRPLNALVLQSCALADGNEKALAGIPGLGRELGALHGNLGRLTGRVMLLLQAEKERGGEPRINPPCEAGCREGDSRDLREAFRARRHEAVQTAGSTAAELAKTIRDLSEKTVAASTVAKLHFLAAEESRAALLAMAEETALYARQAAEAETGAESSLALAVDTGGRAAETALHIENARNAAFSLAGNLETVKADIAEMADTANAVRDVAEHANLLGCNFSLEDRTEKNVAAVTEKIRAVAENAMTAAGILNDLNAALEQQHALQSQSLNACLSALRRAAAANSAAETAAAKAGAASAATVEQFRVLATALEGAAQTGGLNKDQAEALALSARDMAATAENAAAVLAGLNALANRLAEAVSRLEEEETAHGERAEDRQA